MRWPGATCATVYGPLPITGFSVVLSKVSLSKACFGTIGVIAITNGVSRLALSLNIKRTLWSPIFSSFATMLVRAL